MAELELKRSTSDNKPFTTETQRLVPPRKRAAYRQIHLLMAPRVELQPNVATTNGTRRRSNQIRCTDTQTCVRVKRPVRTAFTSSLAFLAPYLIPRQQRHTGISNTLHIRHSTLDLMLPNMNFSVFHPRDCNASKKPGNPSSARRFAVRKQCSTCAYE